MKKDRFLSLISITVLPVGCMFILRFLLKMSCCDILEELIIAIFTGCILAIPNVVIFLITSNNRTNNELHIVLYNIKKNVNELKPINENAKDNLENSLQILCDLHKKLEVILSENYLKDYDKINDISENLLRLLTKIRTALEILKNDLNDKNKNSSVYSKIQNQIMQTKNDIIKTIKSLSNDI